MYLDLKQIFFDEFLSCPCGQAVGGPADRARDGSEPACVPLPRVVIYGSASGRWKLASAMFQCSELGFALFNLFFSICLSSHCSCPLSVLKQKRNSLTFIQQPLYGCHNAYIIELYPYNGPVRYWVISPFYWEGNETLIMYLSHSLCVTEQGNRFA